MYASPECNQILTTQASCVEVVMFYIAHTILSPVARCFVTWRAVKPQQHVSYQSMLTWICSWGLNWCYKPLSSSCAEYMGGQKLWTSALMCLLIRLHIVSNRRFWWSLQWISVQSCGSPCIMMASLLHGSKKAALGSYQQARPLRQACEWSVQP